MPGRRKPELSITGLVAGAAATITSTVAASYFGVGGTLIGAAVVSVLSTVGASVYQHFLDRGKARLAAKIPLRVPAGGESAEPPEDAPASNGRPWPRWWALCGAATLIFLAVMGLVTTFEVVTGKPLANTVRGRAGHGTSVHPVRTVTHLSPGPVTPDRKTPDTTPTPSVRPTATHAPASTPTPSSGVVESPVSVAPTTPEISRPSVSPPAEDVRPLQSP